MAAVLGAFRRANQIQLGEVSNEILAVSRDKGRSSRFSLRADQKIRQNVTFCSAVFVFIFFVCATSAKKGLIGARQSV
jgi:hypothetical protein